VPKSTSSDDPEILAGIILLRERVVDRWNKLDQRDIECGSINGFKNKLEGTRKTRISLFMDYSSAKPDGLSLIKGTLILVWPHQVNDRVNYQVNYTEKVAFGAYKIQIL